MAENGRVVTGCLQVVRVALEAFSNFFKLLKHFKTAEASSLCSTLVRHFAGLLPGQLPCAHPISSAVLFCAGAQGQVGETIRVRKELPWICLNKTWDPWAVMFYGFYVLTKAWTVWRDPCAAENKQTESVFPQRVTLQSSYITQVQPLLQTAAIMTFCSGCSLEVWDVPLILSALV